MESSLVFLVARLDVGELQHTIDCVSQLSLHNHLRAPNSMAHSMRIYRILTGAWPDHVRPLGIRLWKAGFGALLCFYSGMCGLLRACSSHRGGMKGWVEEMRV